MYKHLNSAARLHKLMRQANGLGYNQLAKIWLTLFDIKHGPDDDAALLLFHPLGTVLAEISCLENAAGAQGVSEVLYKPLTLQLRRTASPTNVGHQLGSFGEVEPMLLSLHFLAEMLPADEAPITEEQLADMVQAVNDLELALSEPDIPSALRVLLRAQLDILRTALVDYRVAGVRAFKDASNAWMVSSLGGEATIRAERDQPGVKASIKAWQRMNQAADAALKVDSLIQLGDRLLKLAGI